MKKYLFYITNDGTIGVRKHHFDWKENDKIMTNGSSSRILKVFDGNSHNIMIANKIMKTLNKVGKIRTRLGYRDGMPAIIQSGYKWRDANAKLEYVNEKCYDLSNRYVNIPKRAMSEIEQMTYELNLILHSDTYQFEIDTEDYVFGFKKTIRKRTKNLAKAIQLQVKLANDCGRFLSDTVRIVAVRIYRNDELRKELRAEEITSTYNG